MAEKSGKDESLAAIKQRIDRSREELARDLGGLRYELDIPRKIRRSFQGKTVVWLTAAAAVGLVLTLLPSRKKKVYVLARGPRKGRKAIVQGGAMLGALKIVASVLKPVLVSLAIKKVNGFAGRSQKKW